MLMFLSFKRLAQSFTSLSDAETKCLFVSDKKSFQALTIGVKVFIGIHSFTNKLACLTIAGIFILAQVQCYKPTFKMKQHMQSYSKPFFRWKRGILAEYTYHT